MTFVIRGNPEGLRSSMAFTLSACLHIALLVWLAVEGGLEPPEKPRTIYDQLIRPQETHLIWYNRSDRLPEVKPSAGTARPKPQRALKKFNQEVVAGAKELPRPPQLILAPLPEIALTKTLPLPNVVAPHSAPRPVRAFTAPPEANAPKPRPELALPEAPKVSAASPAANLAMELAGPRPKALPFKPPEPRKTMPELAVLPSAPMVEIGGGGRGIGEMPRIPKGFTPPPGKKAAATQTAEVGLPADAGIVNPAAGQAGDNSLVIVGLKPLNTTDIPAPPGSHPAGFSAGPQPRREGSESSADGAILSVPGLSVHGGAKESQPTLVAALAPLTRERMAAMMGAPAPRAPAVEPGAARVSNAPDPRLAGRVVYAVAIQMPNVTSYSGSWLVWYAEHEPVKGAPPLEMRVPVPLRKVDPKYVASAAADGIQGVVRLAAVIRKDGRVSDVSLIHHLDARLNRTAEEALLQWEFTPAMRNGRPVDVDAVFEIPFRLAPKPHK